MIVDQSRSLTKGAISAEPDLFDDDGAFGDLAARGLVHWTGNRAGLDGGKILGLLSNASKYRASVHRSARGQCITVSPPAKRRDNCP